LKGWEDSRHDYERITFRRHFSFRANAPGGGSGLCYGSSKAIYSSATLWRLTVCIPLSTLLLQILFSQKSLRQ
jgi:hypothetical protein